jgi:AcrR family transcriptional regulator
VALPLRLKPPPLAKRTRGRASAKTPNVDREARRTSRAAPNVATVDRIVSAAQTLLLRPAGARVTAKDVCREADISRGTLYRYFGSMNEILEAVALRLRGEADRELHRVVGAHHDPSAQFEAFLTYTVSNQESVRAARLVQVEPLFVIDYLRGNLGHFIDRVLSVMAPVYDAWDAGLDAPLDRQAISEMMVRYGLSELLFPSPEGARPLGMRLRPLIEGMLGAAPDPRPPAPRARRDGV